MRTKQIKKCMELVDSISINPVRALQPRLNYLRCCLEEELIKNERRRIEITKSKERNDDRQKV